MNCLAGFGFMAVLISLSLACAAVASEPPRTHNEHLGLPPATNVWTLYGVVSADYCGPCKEIRGILQQAGAQFKVEHVTSQPEVNAFPTVFYLNSRGYIERDNGERVRQGLYRLPKEPVVIIEWVTKGK